MSRTPLIFTIVALVLAVMSARDYASNEKKFSIRGKIWLRMAIIFAAVGAYLYWMN